MRGGEAAEARPLIDEVTAWTKTVLGMQLVDSGDHVCELFCHRGAEAKRWQRLPLGGYVGTDPSSSNLAEARERWRPRKHKADPFSVEFVQQDPRRVDAMRSRYSAPLHRPFDVVVCHGAGFTMSFQREAHVRRLLKHVAATLRPGGLFFGVIPDSSAIWYRAQKSNRSPPSFGGDGYSVSFDTEPFEPFGTTYRLRLHGEDADSYREEQHTMVHFPTLIQLAELYGLRLVEVPNLMEFYEDYHVMFSGQLKASCGNSLDRHGRLVGALPPLVGLHCAFVFYRIPSVMAPPDRAPLPHPYHPRRVAALSRADRADLASREQGPTPEQMVAAAAAALAASTSWSAEQSSFAPGGAERKREREHGLSFGGAWGASEREPPPPPQSVVREEAEEGELEEGEVQ